MGPLLSCGLAVVLGCAKPPPAGTKGPSAAARSEARDGGPTDARSEDELTGALAIPRILERYRTLDRYSDEFVVDLIYHFDDGRSEVTSTTFATNFVRPDRLRVDVASDDNQVRMISDGQHIIARILDPLTNNFDGQFVARDAPSKCSIADLYSVTELVDPAVPNERLSVLLGAPIRLDRTILSLLLDEGKLVQVLKTATSKLAGSRSDATPQRVFHTIECQTPEGLYRFWIDPGSGLVHRVDYPSTTLGLPAGLARVDLVARVRFTNLEIAKVPFQADTDGQRVDHFVLPPLPASTDLLGKRVEPLVFESDSASLVVDNGADDIAVIVWFADHPSSRLVVEPLDRLRQQQDDGSRIRFVPVIVDASRLESVKERWAVAGHLWVDSLASGRDVLGVTQAPTTVVLGPNNTVHYFEIGANPSVGAAVAATLEGLRSGRPVAEDTLRSIAASRQAYLHQLELAANGRVAPAETPPTTLAPAEPPTLLTLDEKWRCADLTEAGSILIVPGSEKQIVVLEGGVQLAVLNPLGQLQRRIRLELPRGDRLTKLRAGMDQADRGLIAAVGQRQAFVFDFAGKPLLRYPEPHEDTPVVSDIAVLGMGKDIPPRFLVTGHGQGLLAIDQQGRHIWTNRVLSEINSLAVVDADPQGNSAKSILVSGPEGVPFLVDRDGRTIGELPADLITARRVATWPGSALGFYAIVSQAELPPSSKVGVHCLFSSPTPGGRQVVGLNRDWRVVWRYLLPEGVFRDQIDYPQSITLPSVGPTWLFPAPDGSVHFVSADGTFRDSFSTGQHIRGLAGMNIGDKALLLVASDSGVAAFDVILRP